MFYNISNDRVAINKTDRRVPPKRQTRNTHSRYCQIPSTSSDYRKESFFPRTIREWNALPPDIVAAKTHEAFKNESFKLYITRMFYTY